MEDVKDTNKPEEQGSQNGHDQWKREKWERYHRYRSSRMIALTLILVGGIILLIGAFAVGHGMGQRRAFVSGAYGRRGMISGNTVNNFGGYMGGMMTGGRHFGGSILGSVSSISGNTLTVHNSTKDYTVTVSSTTSFYKLGAIAKQSDLKTGDVVIVRGTPNSSGSITARVINIQ